MSTNTKITFNRPALEDLLKRRYFIAPSWSIYGGVAGFFDFGPPGCAVKANVTEQWRKHFVVEENMLEVDTPCVSPEIVLKTSGHVERFTDLMVTDVKTGEFFRADKIASSHLETLLNDNTITDERRKELQAELVDVECLSADDLHKLFQKETILSEKKNEFSFPKPFNLMFASSIGPSGNLPGYMRPETAQGIFVNFRKLLEFNSGKMPFAAACIGQAFRNEIAPRSGLLRLREFGMAEIEHFVDPEDKTHAKFDHFKDFHVRLFSRESQRAQSGSSDVTIGEAVAKGIIGNQTLAYFMARTQLFMQSIGINMAHFRFRQHLEHEMAHYAQDCWDAEIEMSYGWIECVGLADRACFDLTRHMEKSGVDLVAIQNLYPPIEVDVLERVINKGAIGKTLKGSAKAAMKLLNEMDDEDAKALASKAETDGKAPLTLPDGTMVEITPQMISLKSVKKKIGSRKYVPHVIEPSFGIGRIIYGLLEHSYYARSNDVQRAVLRFKPNVAPVKCSVLPLSVNTEFVPFLKAITSKLAFRGIHHKLDDSGQSVGKRYARTDEIGIPFGITVDFQTIQDQTVTLRERDSQLQIRLSIDDAVAVVDEMCENRTTWNDVYDKFPHFDSQEVN